MRFPIRLKLILFVGGPLLVIFGGALLIDYSRLRAAAYRQTEAYLVEVADREAARFDGLFETLAQIARSCAAFIESHADINEEELFRLLEVNVRQHPLVYGSCVAFEPSALPHFKAAGPRREGRFGPYVWRENDALQRMDVAKDAYDYTEEQWEWFNAPRRMGKPRWTEPFFDKGAGDIVMCTYTAPFFRPGPDGGDRVFAGVATVDMPLKSFQQYVGPARIKSGAFVILSRLGVFVSHPDERLIMNQTIFGFARESGLTEVEETARKMVAGERGVQRIRSFDTGEPVMIVYSPIPSSGWSFAAAVPEQEVMAPVVRELFGHAALMGAALGLVLVITLLMAMRITSPVRRLADAVSDLGAGDLGARVGHVRSRDEIGDLARAFDTMVTELKTHVDALTRETAAREAVQSELRVARSIQTSLLPHRDPPFPGRTEFDLCGVNAPARSVAGDFFDYFFVTPDELVFVIADVSGKGVPAAMLMAVTRTLLRHIVATGCGPAEAFRRANGILLNDNEQGMFVTIFLGVYNTRTGSVRYANAGHPPPLRLNGRSGARPSNFGEVTGPILGVLDDADFDERIEPLAAGEWLVLFTDGVPEARSPAGEFFGGERLSSLLADAKPASARALCEAMTRTIADFQNNDLKDDVTILVLRRF